MSRKKIKDFVLAASMSLLISSCQDMHFTSPFCGPDSPDRTPEVKLPAGAKGCYKVTGDITYGILSNSIIYPINSKDAQYIYLMDAPQDELKFATNIDIQGFAGGMCPHPLDHSGNSRLMVNYDFGWWSASTITFNQERNQFNITHLSMDRLKLHESGIKYVLYPAPQFATERTHSASASMKRVGPIASFAEEKMLQPNLGITLIRNDELSTSELFERAQIESQPFAFTGTRVDDKYCESAQLKRFSRKINAPKMAFKSL